MNTKKLSKESSSGHEREDEWSEVTRGERYVIRTTSEEANGAYSMLEVVADPRSGVPMHVHDNEEEHFIILERSSRMETVERKSVPAHPSPSAQAYLMPGAILRDFEAKEQGPTSLRSSATYPQLTRPCRTEARQCRMTYRTEIHSRRFI